MALFENGNLNGDDLTNPPERNPGGTAFGDGTQLCLLSFLPAPARNEPRERGSRAEPQGQGGRDQLPPQSLRPGDSEAGPAAAELRGRLSRLAQGASQDSPGLGSPDFRMREAASRALLGEGMVAVPQLSTQLRNSDLEIARRSEQLIPRILARMETTQLLAFRDEQQRNQLFEQSLGRRPTPAEAAAFGRALDSSIATHLIPPDWQRDASLGLGAGMWDKKIGLPSWQVTERSIEELDRLSTPAGRERLNARITELARINGSQHLSDREREQIAQQIGDLSRLANPNAIADARVTSRLAMAGQLAGSPIPAQAEQARAHVLRAQELARGERGQAQVDKTILSLNLDQNPAFMQAFGQRGGNLERIRQMRQQWEAQRANP